MGLAVPEESLTKVEHRLASECLLALEPSKVMEHQNKLHTGLWPMDSCCCLSMQPGYHMDWSDQSLQPLEPRRRTD